MIKHLLSRCVLLLWLLPSLAWADITSNLVLHYIFDQTSGTTVADQSGNGRTGTITGTPTWVAGKIGSNAIRFDSATDGLTFTGVGSGTSYTIACWIFADLTSTGDAPLLGSASGGSGFQLKANDVINLYTGTDAMSTTSVVHNAWQHVAAVVNGTNTALYIGGVLSNTVVTAGTVTFASVGKGSSAESYQGSMDDMRLYARALVAGDIAQLVALGTPSVSAKRRLLIY